MMQIVLNQVITFQMPAGTISPTGITMIEAYIASQKVTEGEWAKLNPTVKTSSLPMLADDWHWQWQVLAGEFRGNFPARVRQYYYKTYQIKCPPQFLESIGNIAKAHCATQETYTFDFTKRITWNAGDFGDYGSCFWGSNAGARVMLEDNGALAMRFYGEFNRGIARAWIIEIDVEAFIVFNGYGFSGDATLIIASVFAAYTGLHYKRIYLHNSWGSTLYINGNHGYVVASAEYVQTVDDWDIQWDDANAETCSDCGRLLDEYDICWGADDSPYCERCFYNHFGHCNECGETHWNEDLTYVETADADVCDWCYRRDFAHCLRCDDTYRKTRMKQIGERWYCHDCVDDMMKQADNIE
ncbi:MAG: hypothetical protein JNJ61_04375 [Anaerolineae bacterium]|nr:hypothetical protein [Anaerolineae bacterium]